MDKINQALKYSTLIGVLIITLCVVYITADIVTKNFQSQKNTELLNTCLDQATASYNRSIKLCGISTDTYLFCREQSDNSLREKKDDCSRKYQK